ncbi:MAG: hypothetical protein K2Y20_01675 [Sphingomonas sp.]|nr:hypothetical protein [Sphingomonas sp.]
MSDATREDLIRRHQLHGARNMASMFSAEQGEFIVCHSVAVQEHGSQLAYSRILGRPKNSSACMCIIDAQNRYDALAASSDPKDKLIASGGTTFLRRLMVTHAASFLHCVASPAVAEEIVRELNFDLVRLDNFEVSPSELILSFTKRLGELKCRRLASKVA